jgi:TatD DNase family protein
MLDCLLKQMKDYRTILSTQLFWILTMTYQYIDSHAHLFHEDYNNDLESVLNRTKDAGVKYCIVPGIDLKSSREAITLAEKNETIFACIGIHPHEAAKATDKDLEIIEELTSHQKVVAIGEIGLDYHYNFSPRDRQKEIFTLQVEIAIRQNLPIVVHTREATSDVFAIIQNAVNDHPLWKTTITTPKRGVFHCFPGTAEEAGVLRELGFYVSYPGIVTFKNSESLEIVKQIGVQNILLETDSPYMTPVPFRGKRNEPANIVYIGRKIAEALYITEEEVARITSENTIGLFGLHNLKKEF